MSGNKLSPIQVRILEILASTEPAFTLTGGGALVGVYLGHRTTRDLDLFWRERRELGDLAARASERLTDRGFEVSTLQTGQTFHRLQVRQESESCLIDLVAEPTAALEPPIRAKIGREELLVDTSREILASKLTALLGRSEIRDLQDVKALLDLGEDLEKGLVDAAFKDGGFSPLTLAWVLRSFDVRAIAPAVGLEGAIVDQLADFHAWLLDRLVALGSPEE